jgi:hypothetical protein
VTKNCDFYVWRLVLTSVGIHQLKNTPEANKYIVRFFQKAKMFVPCENLKAKKALNKH